MRAILFGIMQPAIPTRMCATVAGELCGVPHAVTSRYGPSKCDERSISEPDNVISVGTQGTLIIGEDTNENQIDSMCE